MAATHYHVLKVAPDAPAEVIRAAYRALAAQCHPDRHADEADALVWMQAVTEAWRVLSDPVARSRYDAELHARRQRRASDGDSRVPMRRRASDLPALPVVRAPAFGDGGLRQRAAAAYAECAAMGGARAAL